MNQITFKQILSTLPDSAGVYFFKDNTGLILYIGKAKNLKNRLTSYLSHDAYSNKAATIIEAADRLDVTTTDNELDAMLLEAALIRQHKPPFNVLLKEGTPFLYFLITSESTPQFLLVRDQKEKGTYFGPFIDKKSTRKIFSFLLKKFRLKLCNKKIENGCMQYHLGICAGSCLSSFDLVAYKKRISFVKTFLTKGYQACHESLQVELKKANKELRFEDSKEIVQILEALQTFSESLESNILTIDTTQPHQTIDLWIFNEQAELLSGYNAQNNTLEPIAHWYLQENSPDEIEAFFLSYYREQPATSIILTNIHFDNQTLIEQFLSEWHHYQVQIFTPQTSSAHYQNLLSLATATQNKQFLQKSQAAQEIKALCGLTKNPSTIDCFDISHHQGASLVGAAVRFVDGIPQKDQFRHFIIKSFEGNNDYAALQEVVARRYKDKSDYPDLIIIDGGKGQLSSVKSLHPLIPKASLAKKEERLFTPLHKNGIVLQPKTAAGQLIIALRDYTHHFAVSFHRARQKNLYKK